MIFDKLFYPQIVELIVNGQVFNVKCNRTSRIFTWLNCPSQFYPAGFKIIGELPPSDNLENELAEEIRQWLQELGEDDEL